MARNGGANVMQRYLVAGRQIMECFDTATRGMSREDFQSVCELVTGDIEQRAGTADMDDEPAIVSVGQGDARREWNGEAI